MSQEERRAAENAAFFVAWHSGTRSVKRRSTRVFSLIHQDKTGADDFCLKRYGLRHCGTIAASKKLLKKCRCGKEKINKAVEDMRKAGVCIFIHTHA